MRWSDLPRDPPRSTLRWFAAIWLVWFTALGCAAWLRGNETAALALTAVALLVGPLGLVRPAAVRPVFVGALVLTFPVGWVVSRVLLGAVFYCVFTPRSDGLPVSSAAPLGNAAVRPGESGSARRGFSTVPA